MSMRDEFREYMEANCVGVENAQARNEIADGAGVNMDSLQMYLSGVLCTYSNAEFGRLSFVIDMGLRRHYDGRILKYYLDEKADDYYLYKYEYRDGGAHIYWRDKGGRMRAKRIIGRLRESLGHALRGDDELEWSESFLVKLREMLDECNSESGRW